MRQQAKRSGRPALRLWLLLLGWLLLGWPIVDIAYDQGIAKAFGYLFVVWTLLVAVSVILCRVPGRSVKDAREGVDSRGDH